jgi:DNA-binding NarL/FixJ family response regulator
MALRRAWLGRLVTIRLAIVDDHPVVRDGTAGLFAAQPSVEVVGVGSTLDDARAMLAAADPPDVLLLDIQLGSDSGLTLLADRGDGERAEGTHRTAIVLLTAFDYPQYAAAALQLGAAGFVVKTAPIAELMAAVEAAAAGRLAFDERARGRLDRLTGRELEIARLATAGRSNDEIGRELGIATKTVEAHLGRLYARFDVASRTELAARALREGWLDVPPRG